ncbi:DYW domain-containing protein [Plasmodiophora brassicae]
MLPRLLLLLLPAHVAGRGSTRRLLSSCAGAVTDAVAPASARSRPSVLYEAFQRAPSVALATSALKEETDPGRAWALFERVTQSGGGHDPGIRLFQTMMAFCKANLRAKAPTVMRAAVSRGIGLRDELFLITFLDACHGESSRAVMLDAIEFYRAAGVRSAPVLCRLCAICRQAHHPESALFLVAEALENDVAITDRLLSTFAACCAEAATPASADLAERLLDLIRCGRIEPFGNLQTFANFVKALLAHGRVDAAAALLSWLEAHRIPPTYHLYTHVLSALSRANRLADALGVLRRMVSRQVKVDAPVFSSLVSCAGRARDTPALAELQAFASDRDLLLDDRVVCAFISAFAACRDLAAAERVFQTRSGASSCPPPADVYNGMVRAYHRRHRVDQAVAMLDKMASATSKDVQLTRVAVYARAGRVADALDALRTLSRQRADVSATTLSTLVRACGRARDLSAVQKVHQHCQARNLAHENAVVRALIGAYDRCGDLAAAEQAFLARSVVSSPDAPTYDAMIAAYDRHGDLPAALALVGRIEASSGACVPPDAAASVAGVLCKAGRLADAVALLQRMVDRGLKVPPAMVTRLVAGCDRAFSIAHLRVVHRHATARALLVDDDVAGAFVEAYAGCGHIGAAEHVVQERGALASVPVSNALMAAYAQHAMLGHAFRTFDLLKERGLRPDGGTLGALLAACNNVGDPGRANAVADDMSATWQIEMEGAHLATVVDVYAKVGALDTAEEMATCRTPDSVVAWTAVLRACYRHRDVERAERVLDVIERLRGVPGDDQAAAYSLMVGVYVEAGRMGEAARLRDDMQRRGIREVPDQTIVQLPDTTVAFTTNDARYHAEAGLRETHDRLARDAAAVNPRSETLAMAHALNASPDGEPVRLAVTRMTTSCHEAVKQVSRVTRRQVLVRDGGTRCHHRIVDGACSCREYW